MRPDAAEWLRLCLIPGNPGSAQRALLAAFGTPSAAVEAAPRAAAAVAGSSVADALAKGPDEGLRARTLEWLSQPGRSLVALGDSDYPRTLLEIADPPTILYAVGDLRLLDRPALAVVGSRNATQQGLADARAFARALSDAGYVIVSGLALAAPASSPPSKPSKAAAGPRASSRRSPAATRSPRGLCARTSSSSFRNSSC